MSICRDGVEQIKTKGGAQRATALQFVSTFEAPTCPHMSELQSCAVCSIDVGSIWLENKLAIAFTAAAPSANTHFVVAPRRHVSKMKQLSTTEAAAVWDLITKLQQRLEACFQPDSFTVGVSDGRNASSFHVRVHIAARKHVEALARLDGVEWLTAPALLPPRRIGAAEGADLFDLLDSQSD
jgi:diadenosine tetraphosphate (Ap4A) HIT family hydrolase